MFLLHLVGHRIIQRLNGESGQDLKMARSGMILCLWSLVWLIAGGVREGLEKKKSEKEMMEGVP